MQGLELLYQAHAELWQKGFLRRPCMCTQGVTLSSKTSCKLSSLRCCCSAEPGAAIPDTHRGTAAGLPAAALHTCARSSRHQLRYWSQAELTEMLLQCRIWSCQIRAELLRKGFLRRPCILVHAAHIISSVTDRKLCTRLTSSVLISTAS